MMNANSILFFLCVCYIETVCNILYAKIAVQSNTLHSGHIKFLIYSFIAII